MVLFERLKRHLEPSERTACNTRQMAIYTPIVLRATIHGLSSEYTVKKSYLRAFQR